MAVIFDRARLGRLKDAVAVVGVGETDYAKDYRGAGGQAVGKGETRVDSNHGAKSSAGSSSRSRRWRPPSSSTPATP